MDNFDFGENICSAVDFNVVGSTPSLVAMEIKTQFTASIDKFLVNSEIYSNIGKGDRPDNTRNKFCSNHVDFSPYELGIIDCGTSKLVYLPLSCVMAEQGRERKIDTGKYSLVDSGKIINRNNLSQLRYLLSEIVYNSITPYRLRCEQIVESPDSGCRGNQTYASTATGSLLGSGVSTGVSQSYKSAARNNNGEHYHHEEHHINQKVNAKQNNKSS